MTDLSPPLLGPLARIDGALLGWLAFTALFVAYVAYDLRRNPGFPVMK